jgi:hypothetical protein
MCYQESAINTNNTNKRPRDPNDPNRRARLREKKYKAWRRHTQPRRAVVFNLDFTIGSLRMALVMYFVHLRLTGRAPPVAMFVQYYLEEGGARPYLKELLVKLAEWKHAERINEVSIFASASNANGWVTFLKQCMELYAGTPGLFDQIIAREQCPRVMTATGLRILVDLSRISAHPNYVVLISHNPEYAINGRVIAVAPYRQYTGDMFKDKMKERVPDHSETIEQLFKTGKRTCHPDMSDFSTDIALNDTALKHVPTVLEMIFPPV